MNVVREMEKEFIGQMVLLKKEKAPDEESFSFRSN